MTVVLASCMPQLGGEEQLAKKLSLTLSCALWKAEVGYQGLCNWWGLLSPLAPCRQESWDAGLGADPLSVKMS